MPTESSQRNAPREERVIWFDLLRILAIYTTVAIHVIAQVRYIADVNDLPWKVYNLFLSFFCWGVPVFIMISGALFLNPQKIIDRKRLYSKNIAKLVIGFCFWAVVYAVVFDIRGKSVDKFLYSAFTGDYHMWFIPMIIVMYMLTPLLRRFTEDLSLTGYFLKLSFFITFLIPQVLFVLDLMDIPYFDSMVQGMSKTAADMVSYFPSGYLFYFIAGHYFTRTELTKKERRIVYLLGIVGYLFTVVPTELYSVSLGTGSQVFQSNTGANVTLMTLAVFTFGKYELSRISLSEKMTGLVCSLSSYCIGIYYVHLLIIKVVYGLLDLSQKTIHPLVTCMVFPVLFFAVSCVAAWIMRRIPLLKKIV